MKHQRRDFLKASVPLLAGLMTTSSPAFSQEKPKRIGKINPRLSLNAFSFNDPLIKGNMTIDGLFEFCAQLGFGAVDLTAYYIPGYPNIPSDELLYHIKQKAFLLGLDISGTGIRNNFSLSDPTKRKEQVQLVKNWIEAAAKMGAPVLRIFSGTNIPDGYTWEQVAQWMVPDLKECADHGAKFGVMVALQNHFDFAKTPSQTKILLQRVNSPWFGLMLDIGSYRDNPYSDVKEMVPYAITWQIKENVYVNGKEEKTDLVKIMEIVKGSGYRGYLPIETLGPGDPIKKVTVFYDEVNKAMEKVF